MLYQWVTYDVLGNAQDGYEVNDVYPTDTTIELASEDDDEAILSGLIAAGALIPNVKRSDVDIDGNDGLLYLNEASDGYPLGELRACPDCGRASSPNKAVR